MENYALCKEAGLTIRDATEIANRVPWHGDYIPAWQVEELLKQKLVCRLRLFRQSEFGEGVLEIDQQKP